MKIHIFIATTQGLVAIQNITPIDDEDISSVVSVNGTSTTANISSSYHNFVKKGVGIIQQMFGACSYRVDISARIDQGNSWQVAMYLAHLAQSKGLLGNGEVTQGDGVICATGEVNTSNLQVLAVSDVAVKLKLAQPQLEEWSALGAEVQFLLPQANQSEIKKNHYTSLVNNLEQAAMALPNTTKEQSTVNIKDKKLVSTNSRHKLIFIGVILFLVLAYGINDFFYSDSSKSQNTTNKTNVTVVESILKIQLQALLKQSKSCAKNTSQNIALSGKVFADLALNQLCELYLQTPKSQGQLLLIAQDAYTVLPLIQSLKGWQIPLPKNRISHRSYFLVTLSETLSEAKVEQLRLYRETMPKPELLTESALADWLQTQEVEFVIYSHKLVVD
jgi:hypothetical protein